jgi:cell division septum initiation protein DivIVA
MADNATLKSQYLAQVEADLERNTKEKERIAADLAALQEQLTILEQDHALLTGVQQTLVSTSPSRRQDTEPVGVPADVPPAAVPRARKPKAAPRTPKPSAEKTAAASTATGTGSSSGAPTLVELVIADLTGHSEPRSAAEIATALTQAHPGRKIQTTVVRGTLEALVAKGRGLRSKQGRAVYYSAAEASPAPSAAATSAATAA